MAAFYEVIGARAINLRYVETACLVYDNKAFHLQNHLLQANVAA